MNRDTTYLKLRLFITLTLLLGVVQLTFSQSLQNIIDGDHRSEKNKARTPAPLLGGLEVVKSQYTQK